MSVSQPSWTFPVAMYELGEGDRGFVKGARIRVDEVDGGETYFKSMAGANEYIARHGLKHIDEDEMLNIREAMEKAMSESGDSHNLES